MQYNPCVQLQHAALLKTQHYYNKIWAYVSGRKPFHTIQQCSCSFHIISLGSVHVKITRNHWSGVDDIPEKAQQCHKPIISVGGFSKSDNYFQSAGKKVLKSSKQIFRFVMVRGSKHSQALEILVYCSMVIELLLRPKLVQIKVT